MPMGVVRREGGDDCRNLGSERTWAQCMGTRVSLQRTVRPLQQEGGQSGGVRTPANGQGARVFKHVALSQAAWEASEPSSLTPESLVSFCECPHGVALVYGPRCVFRIQSRAWCTAAL